MIASHPDLPENREHNRGFRDGQKLLKSELIRVIDEMIEARKRPYKGYPGTKREESLQRTGIVAALQQLKESLL